MADGFDTDRQMAGFDMAKERIKVGCFLSGTLMYFTVCSCLKYRLGHLLHML
jgi:hypothetical protein